MINQTSERAAMRGSLRALALLALVLLIASISGCQTGDTEPAAPVAMEPAKVPTVSTPSPTPIEKPVTQTEELVPNDPATRVLLNQAGVHLYGPKTAFVVNPSSPARGRWQVLRLPDRKPVLDGELLNAKKDPFSGHHIVDIDFSSLTTKGRYQIIAAGAESVRFSIDAEPYDRLLTDLLRSFYLQRCGVNIDDLVTGIARAACHVNDGHYAHADLSHAGHDHGATTGGWHDAGDYGKYVATTAVTITEILSRVEQFPAVLHGAKLQIPESENATPDVLDEMRVGLDWLVSMQRPDGALYRKLSGKAWPKVAPPEEDAQQRFIYGPTTSDTAKAVASFAIAARTFKKFDATAAQRYLDAATAGWSYLKENQTMLFDYREGDDSGSGPYRANDTDVEESLRHDRDDRLAAAIELFLVTGDADLLMYIRETLPGHRLNLFEWKDPSAQSLTNFFWHPATASFTQLRAQIRGKLVSRARAALLRSSTNAWRVANTRFIWGSNKMAAEEGVLLLQGWRLTGQSGYLNAAVDQLDYLLGRNPNDKSYVTGAAAGERSVRNIAHIYVRATGKLIPGLLVGGPNEKAQAKIAPANQNLMSYADDARSYATNEYAIDYTSALIALIVDLEQAQTTLYADQSEGSPPTP